MVQQKSLLTKPLMVCLLAGICCLLWGSAFPCVKIGYRLFQIESQDTYSQLLFAGCRFTLAGILVLIFTFFQNCFLTKNTKHNFGNNSIRMQLFPTNTITWKRILLLCLFQTVIQYFFFYIGLAHTSGVKASIIEGTNVFVSILTASLVFHMEKLTPSKIIGCVTGFAGVVLVNIGSDGWNLSIQLTGEGFIFISTFAYALSSVLIKKFSQEESPFLLSGWQFLLGGVLLMTVGFLLGGRIHLNSLTQAGMLFYLAFISAGAYTLWGILIKHNPVSQVSVYGFMNPVFGVILSWILLKDSSRTLGMKSIFALVFVCIGIYIVNRNTIKQ